jgi:protein-L-isoaspartate(D-aspartate) O-methyltransferase
LRYWRTDPALGMIVVDAGPRYKPALGSPAPGIEGSRGNAMTVYDAARVNMVESQLRPNKVTDQRVIEAFMRIRRELFVPERLRGVSYVDDDLPLGGGRYLMQPMVAARLLQAAIVEPTDAALVVGAGVGYEAALLAQLARSVVALDENPELARIGRSALVDHRIASVSYVEAPLRSGHRQRLPYDVILFGGAVTEIPGEIAGQLAEGGRIAVVLRQHECVGRATLITRTGGGLAHRVIFDAATPLLPDLAAKPVFVF